LDRRFRASLAVASVVAAAIFVLELRPDNRSHLLFAVSPGDSITYWLGLAGAAFLFVFGAIIGWRRPDLRSARLLSLVLVASVFGTLLDAGTFGYGGPIVTRTAWTLAAIAGSLAPLYFALYAQTFGAPSKLRARLTIAQYPLALLGIFAGVAPVIAELTHAIAPDLARALWLVDPGLDLQYLFALASGIAAVAASRGDERQRILWATIATAPYILANALIGAPGIPLWIGDIAIAIWPIGLAYAALRGKLLDVGFAFNRAAVFTVLSAIVLVLFVAFEWVLAETVKPFGHDADILLTLGFALALGISMRYIHHKVDHVLDHVLFRKRNADLAALRSFAQEAPFIASSDVLFARAASVVSAHASGAPARVVRDEGADRDDPAMVALRARRTPQELPVAGSVIEGVYAFPIFAGPALRGALVVGAKPDGGIFAPDEIDAIAAVAAGAGQSLLAQRDDDVAALLGRILAELRART